MTLVPGEYRFFEEGTTPFFSTQEFHNDREAAPHIDQHGMQRDRLLLAADIVLDMCEEYSIKTVSDLCCGDGGLLQYLKPSFDKRNIQSWGYEFQPANITQATNLRDVDVRYANVVEDDIEFGELCIMTECLEHFEDPHAMVRKVAENSKAIVISSPNGETPEAHYEFHTWGWSWPAYENLLTQAGYEVVCHEESTIFQVLAGALPE